MDPDYYHNFAHQNPPNSITPFSGDEQSNPFGKKLLLRKWA
jgi:hypothetical protein